MRSCVNGVDDLAGILEFAEGALAERDRERLQRTIDHARHQRCDRAAVKAAREKHPERDVGHEPGAHSLFQPDAELRDRVGVAELLHLRSRTADRHIPPLPR